MRQSDVRIEHLCGVINRLSTVLVGITVMVIHVPTYFFVNSLKETTTKVVVMTQDHNKETPFIFYISQIFSAFLKFKLY